MLLTLEIPCLSEMFETVSVMSTPSTYFNANFLLVKLNIRTTWHDPRNKFSVSNFVILVLLFPCSCIARWLRNKLNSLKRGVCLHACVQYTFIYHKWIRDL